MKSSTVKEKLKLRNKTGVQRYGMNDFHCVHVSTGVVRLGRRIVAPSHQSDAQRPQSASPHPLMLRPAGSVSAADALEGRKLF